MTDRGHRISTEDDALKSWRQGDFAVDVGGFLFAGPAENEDAFEAEEHLEKIVGLIAISQSCDIVRRTGRRDHVTVCPLIQVDADELAAIRSGRRPYLTTVENTHETIVADLRRIMSVDKDLVRKWDRQEGFSSEEGRVRFAAALERKFGQFAFPDKFDHAMKPFRNRVWSRHTKTQSGPGKVYRSLVQIRFRAEPDWSAEKRIITVIAIMFEQHACEVGRGEIKNELDDALNKIQWPEGYEWGSPRFVLGTAKDLTAEDIITSRRGDFDFLCY